MLVSTSPSRPPSTTLRCLPSTVVFCDNDCPPGSVVPSPGTVNGWTMLPIAPMSASGGMYLAISSRPSTRSTTERLKAAGALLAQMAVADISGEEGPCDQVADRAAVARHRSRWSPKCRSGGGGALSGPRICSQGSVGLHRAKMSGTEHSTSIHEKTGIGGEALQIDSLYKRPALRHRISSRSATGSSAKLLSIMRVESGYVDADRGNSDSHSIRSIPT